jgi:hypothetical protein
VLSAIWVELDRARRSVATAVTLSQDIGELATRLRLPPAAARGVALRLRGAPWSLARATAGTAGCQGLQWSLAALWILCAGSGVPPASRAAETVPGYGLPRFHLQGPPRRVLRHATGEVADVQRQGHRREEARGALRRAYRA